MPFQQFGKRRLNTSELFCGHPTTTANFLLDPPPQLHETTLFACGRFAFWFPATIFRPGGIVAIDNVLWGGAVADPEDDERQTQVLRSLTAKIRADERATPVLLPVGDGVMLARKR